MVLVLLFSLELSVKSQSKYGISGITFSHFVVDYSSLILAKICQDCGLRGFVGKLSMDISSQPSYIEKSAEQSAEAVKDFIDDCRGLVSHLPVHDRLVEPVVTPRFIPTCSAELLSRLGDLAMENDLWIQSHMAESKDQVAWVKETRGLEDMDIFLQVRNIESSSKKPTDS